jgi:glycosyltransferase involved in cell wall biosynthesis
VVVPVLDERDALPELLDEIVAATRGIEGGTEIVVVDDGSTDGTDRVLIAETQRIPGLRVVTLRRNFGKSVALRIGWTNTTGDAVITMDGDGQDDPAEIPRLLERLAGGYDLVSGWKVERHDPLGKRLPSKAFNRVTAKVSGVPLHDMNCGLKAYDGDAVRKLDLYGEQHRFIPVLGHQRGWRITELPVNHRSRIHGSSKFGIERFARGLLDLMTVVFLGRYSQRPLHLFGGAGLISIAVGVLVCAYLTVLKLSGSSIGERPLLILGVLLIVVGVQLMTLGLVGEMIAATRQAIRGPRSNDEMVAAVIERPAEDPVASEPR